MSDSEHRLDEKLRDRARRLRRDMTMPEWRLWSQLKQKRLAGWRFRRQHPMGPFIVDFCCVSAKLVIELDGQTHVGAGERDDARTGAIERMGFRVIRFTDDDVMRDAGAVAGRILAEIQGECRHSS